MTFKEFCKAHKLTPQEKRMAAAFLMALRLARMWENFMGDEEDG
jgi:hypothetical protein